MGNCDFSDSISKEINTKVNKNLFISNHIIGQGGYGKVWKVKSKIDNKDYAMKEMSKALILAKKSVMSINFEKEILSRIYHPFICNICYAFQDFDNLYLVLELASGGDLRFHLYKNIKFNEIQTKFIIACLLLALEYIHSLALIHRDIKPENILFTKNGYIKLTDFGIARTWAPNNSSDTSGTPGYMAPEVVFSLPHGLTSDFWALGIIIYELMYCKRPYIGTRRKEYKDHLNKISIHIKDGEQPYGWSKECIDIVNKLLQRKEEKRLGSRGIEEIKNHPWFKNINWDDLINMKILAPFIPKPQEEFNDSNYNESLGINTNIKGEITIQDENLKNLNVQKLFRDFYFNQDNERDQRAKLITTSSSYKISLSTLNTFN